MAVRIGINGFGRIGRLFLREAVKNPNVEIVGVNDLVPADALAYLLKYDTVHGRFDGEVVADGNALIVNGKNIPTCEEKDPTQLPWGQLETNYVVESTGIFTDKEKAGMHLKAGAKRVIISAPAKGEGVPTIVMGVNHDTLKASDTVVSNASCTTNCLAPDHQGRQRQLRPRRGPDDHHPRHDRHPADRRRPVQEGLARRPLGIAEHHPGLDRGGEGRRSRDPGDQGQADRHGLPRADRRRLVCRPDLQDREGHLPGRDQRRHEGRQRRAP
jgi:hypothetical protein